MEGTTNAAAGPGSNQKREEPGNPAGSPEGKGKNGSPRLCGVTLIVRNRLRGEFFEYRQTVTNPPQSALIRYLESAADKDPHFKFNATYHPNLGYFIETINGLTGIWTPDKTCWKMWDSDGKSLNLGVSSYYPEDQEVITFDFGKCGQCV